MKLYSKKLGELDVEDSSFASGGAGAIHHATASDGRRLCVKILTKNKPADIEKIRYMCGDGLPVDRARKGWGLLCWPIDVVGKRNAAPIGYVMPLAISGSLDFSNLTNLQWPGRNLPEMAQRWHRTKADGMSNRMKIGCNLAAAIDEVHKLGCVFVDLKPQNVLVSNKGLVSLVDLDSLQVKSANAFYPGPLGSPEYMPAESYRMDFSRQPVIGQSWDYFSLAVILYELLLGIHPYTATVSPTIPQCETIQDSIRFRLYANGSKKSDLAVIPAPHKAFSNLPQGLRDLFSRAFDLMNPADRPTAKEWGEALLAATNSGASSMPAAVYNVRTPNSTKQTVRQNSLPVAASRKVSQAEVHCWGPVPGGACPGVPTRRGVPNYALNSSKKVYLCPSCKRISNVPFPVGEPCWGPIGGGNCLQGANNTGVPNYPLPHGHRVYICPTCMHNSSPANSTQAPQAFPKTTMWLNPSDSSSSGSSSSMKPDSGCAIHPLFFICVFVLILKTCHG